MHANNPVRRPPIAIVGVSALFPGSLGAAPFWRNIMDGKDLITDVPASHWRIEDYYDPNPAAPDKTYAKRGGFLPPVPFDPLSFGIPPSTLSATDTAQLLALVVARQVLDDASRGQFREVDRRRISVILGVASATELVVELGSRIQRPIWANAMRAAGLSETQVQDVCDRIANSYVPWQEASFPGLLGNVVAGRIANRLDLGGTNAVTDAACASSFAAIEMGLNELYLGQSDLVISGGVDAINDIFMYMCFSKTPALSPSGDCRPFSDKADGTMLGEGIGMFALRRLEDAERDGNPIYAVIRGLGSSSDGRATSIYGPRSEGQALALSRAYEAAGYSPATVELVEAHGTGTKAGDLAEVGALKQVFGAAEPDRTWCALGSIKSQIGHTKAAAGAAGLFKTVMALRHKVLPPTIKVERPAAAVAPGAGPFYVNTRARPWIRTGAHPRRASVSSFGFGGSNFHLTLEEYTGTSVAERLPTQGAALFLLSAESREALSEKIGALQIVERTYFAEARASQLAFDSIAAARLAVAAESFADLQHKLNATRDALSSTAVVAIPGVHAAFGKTETGSIAFVFAGQGSQYVGMGADLAMEFDAARAVWDSAIEDGSDPLHDVVFPHPAFDAATERAQQLALTEVAQPALAAMSLAQLALLGAVGLQPDCTAGHSFGEVMALHCAGAFDAETALRIARKRGGVMRDAAGEAEGAMLAVAAGSERVEELLHNWGLDVVVANDNAPDQVVLSGGIAAITECEQRLSGIGLRSIRLPVASAFHSAMVSGASVPFGSFLGTQAVSTAALPVYGTAAAVPYPSEPDSMRATLAAQLARPVRFREQVDALYAAGVRAFVEVGPSAVLSGLIERCLGQRPAAVIPLDRKGRNGAATFWEALGRLAVAGRRLDFAPLWVGVRVEEAMAPATPGTVQLLGSNFGKPYPTNIEIAAPVPTPVAAPHPPATAAPASAGPDQRLAVFAAFQEQIAESQKAFQTALADSHRAFLETTQKALEALSGGTPLPAMPAAAPPRAVAQVMQPPPVVHARAPEPVAARPAPLAAPAPGRPAAPATADAAATLLAVVAEKTGYPVEMLNLSMSLESDLGVDSIKQVEILAALRERAPGLRDIDASDLAQLRTLGAVVAFLGEGKPIAAPAPMPVAAVASHPGVDTESVLLAVVAEKTGYPREMLNLSMSLEGDLGIDSIKQVEILAALRERAQGLPELESGDLARLRTLGAIVEFLKRGGDVAAPIPAPAPAPMRIERAVVVVTEASSGQSRRWNGRHVAIVPDRGGVGTALAALLRREGIEATLSSDIPLQADTVLYLPALDSSADHAVALHRDALLAAKAVAARFAQHGGTFLTVQDSGGTFGVEGGIAAPLGLTGLVKCAALEWPRATVKAVDLAAEGRSPAVLAADLLAELQFGGAEREVGLRRGRRLSLTHHSAQVTPEPEHRLMAESVVVISGGARGVTAASAIALADAYRCRLVLLGRTPLSGKDSASEREIRATLAAIEQTGGSARYVAVDVRDADAVAAALAEVRNDWGPISGLIHGAGVIADSRIANKTPAQFDSVFGTKVLGLQALLAALRSDPLSLLCVFSSVAARSGNIGQSDYAMANAVITQIAHAEARRRGPDCLVKAIHWGPWAGGMVNPALAERFQRSGVPLIPLDGGAAFLVQELADAGDAIEVVAGGPLPGGPDAVATRIAGDLTA